MTIELAEEEVGEWSTTCAFTFRVESETIALDGLPVETPLPADCIVTIDGTGYRMELSQLFGELNKRAAEGNLSFATEALPLDELRGDLQWYGYIDPDGSISGAGIFVAGREPERQRLYVSFDVSPAVD